MTRHIPRDILEKARGVVGKPNAAVSARATNTMVRLVALTILDERERCAAIIEQCLNPSIEKAQQGRAS